LASDANTPFDSKNLLFHSPDKMIGAWTNKTLRLWGVWEVRGEFHNRRYVHDFVSLSTFLAANQMRHPIDAGRVIRFAISRFHANCEMLNLMPDFARKCPKRRLF
jgi:hypothetical protein